MKSARSKPTPTAEASQLGALVVALREHGAEAVLHVVSLATQGGYQGLPVDRLAKWKPPAQHNPRRSAGYTDADLRGSAPGFDPEAD